MIFWILLTITVLAAFFVAVKISDSVGEFLGFAALNLFVGGLVLAFISIGLQSWAGRTATSVKAGEETRTLQALGTGTETEGRTYFLGSGFINEKPVFSYLWGNETEGFKLDRSNASDSTIYQNENDNPRVLIEKYDIVPNPWVAPFTSYYIPDQYTYYIPEGSISNSYEVKP